MNSSSNNLTASGEKSSFLSIGEDRTRNSSLILKQSRKPSSVTETLDIKERIRRIIRRVHMKMRIYYIFKKARDIVNQNVISFLYKLSMFSIVLLTRNLSRFF